MAVWRLHLRPEGLDPRKVVRHCLTNDLLGVGWGNKFELIEAEPTADYLRRHEAAWNKRVSSVWDMIARVKLDDFIWARDERGRYLLGRVTGATYVRVGHRDELQDMFHVAPVRILEGDGSALVDTEVPGKVRSIFAAPGPALRRINDSFVDSYTAWLFATKTGAPAQKPSISRFISALGPYELEDLVLLYLQEHGWRIVLSSHFRSTPRYECTLIKADGSTAGVQVKHQGVRLLNAADYGNDAQVGTVFLFAASGNYGNTCPANVTTIAEKDLEDFARLNRALLPKPIAVWL